MMGVCSVRPPGPTGPRGPVGDRYHDVWRWRAPTYLPIVLAYKSESITGRTDGRGSRARPTPPERRRTRPISSEDTRTRAIYL